MREFRPDPKPEKQPKKIAKPLKRSAIKKTFIPTGEKEIFEAVVNNLPDTETRCFVCGTRIPYITHNNMAHIISKNKYPLFRLEPRNIVILCHKIIADENGQGCHFRWDMEPRSKIVNDERWQELLKLEAGLKEEYRNL